MVQTWDFIITVDNPEIEKMAQIASDLENNHTGRELSTSISLGFLTEILTEIFFHIIKLKLLSGFPYRSLYFCRPCSH